VGHGWAEGSGQARGVAIVVELTCPGQYGRSVLWCFSGEVKGVHSGSTQNEVGSITTADAGAVARLHDHGGIPSLGCGCDVSEQLAAVESLKGSNAASNALRSLLMKPDAFSP